MKNLILMSLVLVLAISQSFAQLKVVAPDGDVNLGDVTAIPSNNIRKLNIEQGLAVGAKSANGTATGIAYFEVGQSANSAGQQIMQTTFGHIGEGKFLLRTFEPESEIQILGKDANNKNRTAFIMKANGRVGIGTANPQASLQLKGNGAMKNSAGMWLGSSDKRLKNNIQTYDQGIEAILKLNPVTFNYNGKAGIEDTETTHVGLVAQDYQKVAPDAVKKYSYRDVDEIDDENGNITYKYGPEEEYLSIDPTPVMYMLVNAVKEQQAIITELQEEVINLKSTGVSNAVNSTSVLLAGSGVEKGMLSQNTPNPFTSNTKIEYFVPETAGTAVMSFTDISGKEIKTIAINGVGSGSLDVSIKEMPIGIYSYSLVVDGSTIATKKMVLSR